MVSGSFCLIVDLLIKHRRHWKINNCYSFDAVSCRPLTNYYQYSLGVLALCVSGIRVNHHVSNKLIKAVELEDLRHGDSVSVGK